MSYADIDLQYVFLAVKIWVIEYRLLLKISLIALGLGISLFGSILASNLPFEKGFKLASGWGGGEKEEWDIMNELFRTRSMKANVCFVVRTFLQIVGTLM